VGVSVRGAISSRPDDGAVRPPRARNDDISCNGAALRVEPACSCVCGALPLARATAAAFAMASLHAARGISQLLYLVPVPLAATLKLAASPAVLHVLLAPSRPLAGAAAREGEYKGAHRSDGM
jgi:hypothetical protein